LSVDNRSRKNK